MSRLMALAAIILALTGPVLPQAGAQERSPALRAAAVNRTTLVVADIERSVDFYQRLGLVKWSDTSSGDTDKDGVIGAADLPLTADSKRSRLVILRGGDERNGLLGLLWYDKPQLPSARGNLVGIGTGDVIVGIEVGDLQGAYNRLNQIGTRFHRPPGRFTTVGADGTAQSGQHMMAYDPDGHMIEIVQAEGAKR